MNAETFIIKLNWFSGNIHHSFWDFAFPRKCFVRHSDTKSESDYIWFNSCFIAVFASAYLLSALSFFISKFRWTLKKKTFYSNIGFLNSDSAFYHEFMILFVCLIWNAWNWEKKTIFNINFTRHVCGSSFFPAFSWGKLMLSADICAKRCLPSHSK